jgi:hypothetical protein
MVRAAEDAGYLGVGLDWEGSRDVCGPSSIIHKTEHGGLRYPGREWAAPAN